MKIVYYECDGCKKQADEMLHLDLSGKTMDLCMVCGSAVAEAITAALIKVTDGKYAPKQDEG